MHRILGQDRALDVLHNALRSGRFHHAWIFSGPQGVGKCTTAVELARILLDPEERSAFSDQRSASAGIGKVQDLESKIQNLIDSNTHPDLHIIRKELALFSDNPKLRDRKLMNIPLDLLREHIIGGKSGEVMHEAAAYRTAALGHGKVFIIDEAELLVREGQNAMLKTLEEPPPQTWFFLITSQPDRLLPTIRSRCQHVHFGPLDERAMQEWWKQQVSRVRSQVSGKDEEEEAAFDPKRVPAATLQWVFQFADGSPGLALLALEYGFHEWQRTLEPMLHELDRGRFPVPMGGALGEMVEQFAVAWVKKHGKDSTSKDAANKDGARHVLSLLGSHARRRLAETAHSNADAAERWALTIDLLRECEAQIASNVNQKLAMENLVAQWAAALSGAIVV